MKKKIPTLKLMKDTFFDERKTKKSLCKFILKSKKLSMDNQVSKWEKNFSKWQKRKYSISVNSGSSANLVLIQSLLNLKILKKGDFVGFSAVTWSTNVMPLIQLGLNIIPIDVSLKSLNISINNIKIALKKNKKIKCIFLTNVLGFCDSINDIKNYCKEKNILLLEDNCESLGSEINNIKLGNFSFASTFSTFVGHHLSTIEGGLVSTDNYDLYQMLKLTRAHGWSRNLNSRDRKKLEKKNNVNSFYSKYSFYDLAFNCRPTEISGFLGNIQLNKLSNTIKKRDQNFRYLYSIYKNNKNFIHYKLDHMNLISNFAFPVICENRNFFYKIIKKILRSRIEVRPLISGNIVRQPFIKKYLKTKIRSTKYLYNAEKIHNNGFYLPNNPYLSKEEIRRLVEILSYNLK